MATSNWKIWTNPTILPSLIAIGLGTSFVLPASAQSIPITTANLPLSDSNLVPLHSNSNQINFTFTNVLEYSDCLSAILDLYQGKMPSSLPTRQNACATTIQQAAGSDGLSESEARELLSAADFYSTHMLSRGLYPPKGLRLRIAELLGFIYAIDQNDAEILERAAR